jgi:hypothetical protein
MNFDRNPKTLKRQNRNWQRGAGNDGFTRSLNVTAPLTVATGSLVLTLASNSGLEVASSALQIDVRDTSLSLTAAGIGVVLRTNAGLNISSGVGILLPANSGLQTLSGGLSILLNATNPALSLTGGLNVLLNGTSLTKGASGLSVSAATLTVAAGVKMNALLADLAVLTDNSGGTSGNGTIAAIGIAVTDPADAPVDADALRDDLVLNTIPSIETELAKLRNAVATLAAYSTTIEDKINAIFAGEKTSGQMSAT